MMHFKKCEVKWRRSTLQAFGFEIALPPQKIAVRRSSHPSLAVKRVLSQVHHQSIQRIQPGSDEFFQIQIALQLSLPRIGYLAHYPNAHSDVPASYKNRLS